MHRGLQDRKEGEKQVQTRGYQFEKEVDGSRVSPSRLSGKGNILRKKKA